MKQAIRDHVIQELKDYNGNRQLMVRLTQEIRAGGRTSTRESLALLHRLMCIKNGIVGCGLDGKLIYTYRYRQNLSWIAIAMKMHLGEATVKRYHAKLLESVAKSLGWI